MRAPTQFISLLLGLLAALQAHAVVLQYADQDVLGTGTYSSDPTAGATLEGLLSGVVTYATLIQGHGYPFVPAVGDFPGTDQIYVGQTQTGSHDGYSTAAERTNDPQIFILDYSSLVPAGNTILTFTLGIAADDFQFLPFGQPFTASVNGIADANLTSALNGFDQSGPVVQFFTIGLNPALLNPSQVLSLTINQGGDGGDGWAVDYLTLGVTSAAVPEPSSMALVLSGIVTLAAFRRSAQRSELKSTERGADCPGRSVRERASGLGHFANHPGAKGCCELKQPAFSF